MMISELIDLLLKAQEEHGPFFEVVDAREKPFLRVFVEDEKCYLVTYLDDEHEM
jgi:hypothetical protein